MEKQSDEIEHRAGMISFIFLSEIEKYCEIHNITRTKLAADIGTSKSYLTQLFRGDKQVNTKFISRVENALGVHFEIKLIPKPIQKIQWKSNL